MIGAIEDAERTTEAIRYYPELLRNAGYYCANSSKTDYNIGGQQDAEHWDLNGKIDWASLPDKQPFFQVWNLTDCHESSAHGKLENIQFDAAKIQVAAYHPDLPSVRQNYAKYYDAIGRLDRRVGSGLERLASLGLDENTIVIFNSDHGGVLPRSKRFLYRSGLHCPLIVRIPQAYQSCWPAEEPGTEVDRLVSFIDMPRTWLALCDIDAPVSMQGQVFLGAQQDPPREYHFAYRARMDERVDNVRAVTDGRFLYIRNYLPMAIRGQELSYLWRQQATRAWQAEYLAGRCDAVTGRFFRPRIAEELYDLQQDPDNVRNLAGESAYREIQERFGAQLRLEQLDARDSAMMPEAMVVQMADNAGIPIVEFCRDDKRYPLADLLAAADLALTRDLSRCDELSLLASKRHPGLRYWAAIGLCWLAYDCRAHVERVDFLEPALLTKPNDEQRAKIAAACARLLDDEDRIIRSYAAWALLELGDASGGEDGGEAARDILRQGILMPGPERLEVLNIVDWAGDIGVEFADEIQGLATDSLTKYEQRIVALLRRKFSR